MSELWNRLDFGFFEPIWLGVGAVAVIAVILLEIGSQRRRREAMRLFAAEHLLPGLTGSVSPGKRLLKRVLLVCAVAGVFLALARPHLLYEWREESRSGVDVLLAVDCSKSMLTDDVMPSRIERAKLAVEDFADRLPDNRLGLIAFAGDAFLECPLTLDHGAFLDAVRELDTDTIPRPGTDIATAIDEAVLALRSQPNNLKFLILITDGEDLEGRVLDAARNAAKAGLKIYTVGVGSSSGAPIRITDDNGGVTFLQDNNGQTVISKLDEATLRQISQITGGAYAPLGQRGEGLEEIYSRYIGPLPKQHLEERREKIEFERYEWPLGAAIILLVVEFLLRERSNARLALPQAPVRRPGRRVKSEPALAATRLLLLAGLWGLGLGTSRAASSATVAERDYKSGQYSDAEQEYRAALENQPDRHDLQYDRGDAAYRAGEYLDAEQAFRQALDTPNLNLQENSYYNLGNSQFKHGEAMEKVDPDRTRGLWEDALKSYESALKLREAPDTRHNYELVKRRLEQLKQQQQQQKNQNSSQSNSQSQSQSSQGGQGQDKNPSQQKQDQSNSQGNQPQGQSQNPPSGQGNGQNPPGQNGQQQSAQNQAGQGNTQQQARSMGSRPQDQQDPAIKSREEAEALLDSLKDDEHHVTAQSLYGNNQPPPTASGKNW